uniref:Ig-like domain-containing protein n=1 Tax=Chrysemys picta bellii TaxID=8478 RepID=A0A8C3HC81_CHRPI
MTPPLSARSPGPRPIPRIAPPLSASSPGHYVTIRCQGQRWDVRFFLHKAGDLNPQRHMDPAGDGAGAEFCIPTVGRPHEGSYSCSYRLQSQPFVSSQPSVPVELVVGSYPKPSISVSPGGVIPVGGNVTIQCRHQRLGCVYHQQRALGGRRELQLLLSQQIGAVRRVVPQRPRGAGAER